jgi:hypothetical protein
MTGIDPTEVNTLMDTLRDLELPDEQRELLDGIIKVAGDIQEQAEEADYRAFSAEFGNAFTKKQADLVLEYVTTPQDTENTIIRSPGPTPNTIIRNPSAKPPTIIRNPPPAPDPDDEN